MLRYLSIYKIFNFSLVRTSYWLSRLFKSPIIWGNPYGMTFEPVNYCQLSCPSCPVGQEILSRRKASVDMHDYERILKQNARSLLNLNLYFQGEPFLHPDIFKMIERANQEKVFVTISTNGHFNSLDYIDKILECSPGKIIFSLDGMNPDSYSTYRKDGNWSQVLHAMKQIAEKKKALNLSFPKIELQFLVFRHNEDEIETVRKLGKDLGIDHISFKSAQFYSEADMESMSPTKEEFARYIKTDSGWKIKSRLPNWCNRIWSTAVITADLNLVSCCFDKDADHIIGNLKKGSLITLWHGQAFRTFRKKVLKTRNSIAICRNCTEGLKVRVTQS